MKKGAAIRGRPHLKSNPLARQSPSRPAPLRSYYAPGTRKTGGPNLKNVRQTEKGHHRTQTGTPNSEESLE